MTKRALKALRRQQAANARAARAAKREAARQEATHGKDATSTTTNGNGRLTLGLERRDARFLFDALAPMPNEAAERIRQQLLYAAFAG